MPLQEEEEMRIREFVSCLDRNQIKEWLRSHAACRIVHGTKLKQSVPPVTVATIEAIIENHRKQLTEHLTKLLEGRGSDRSGWGFLGQAADFLVSQRGLHA